MITQKRSSGRARSRLVDDPLGYFKSESAFDQSDTSDVDSVGASFQDNDDRLHNEGSRHLGKHEEFGEEHIGREDDAQYTGTDSRNNEWTEEEEIHLCKLWERDTHLYDKSTKNHRNAEVRRITLQRFADELSKPVDVVYRHMNSLRTAFGKIINKASGPGRYKITERQRRQKEMLGFLTEHVLTNGTLQTLNEPVAITPGKRKGRPRKSGARRSTSTEARTDIPTQTPVVKSGNESSSSSTILDDSPSKVKRNRRDSSTDRVKDKKIETFNSLANTLSQIATSYHEQVTDYNLLWGKLLGAKVSKMPEHLQDRFKYECDKLAFECIAGKWPH